MLTRRILTTGLASAVGLTGLLMAGTALAQVETITVTAQKREENIQDVPISITAISGDVIEQSGTRDLVDLAFLVPNFQFVQSSQLINARINIRGVTSVGNSAIEPSVGVFIDGAYIPRPGSVIGNLFDVERVEVLRGPQGTLFGRNTPVGALNITTRGPEEEFGASIKANYGSFGTYGVEGHVTGAIADGLAGRIAFNYDDFGGYVENAFSGEDELDREDFGLRGSLAWTVNSAISADLVVDYQTIDYAGAEVEILSESATDAFLNRFETVYGVRPDVRDTFDNEINQIHTDNATNEQWGATLTVDADVWDHTLTSITAYRDWEDEYLDEEVIRLPADILPRDRLSTTENFSQEVRIASPTGQFIEYVAGLFYYEEDYVIDTVFDLGPDYCNKTLASVGAGALAAPCNAAPQDAVIDLFSQELTSYAAFGQATANLTERLSLTGGLRWTRDEKDNGSFQRTVFNPAARVLAPVDENVQGLEQTAEAVNWLVNARYFPADDVMVFATASTGFKSGGFNSEPGASDRIFAEENAKNYELGIKSTLFDNRIVANATLYRTEIDDFQERQFQGLGFIVDNAGSLRQQGLELDVQAAPVEQLDILFGLSYLDSEFTDFANAPSLPGGGPQDLTGERRQDSPEWQVSLAAQWTDLVPDTEFQWFLRGEYQYTDEQFLDSNLNPQSLQEGFSLVNFRAGFGAEDGQWQLVGFVRNAFDEGYCARTFNQVAGGLFGAVNAAENTSVQRCVTGRPRVYGVEASLRY